MSVKPSDFRTISLCATDVAAGVEGHHAEQTRIGEKAFMRRYGIDMAALAAEFAARSPHRRKT